MTRRLYREAPEALEFEARIVGRREHQGRPAVVLDATAFFPEGGGQPWDTGTLGAARVLAVIEHPDGPLHVVDGNLDTDTVRGVVDGVRRRDHTQQHHGQHLLSRAFVEVAAAATVGFHLGAEVVTIDLAREVSQPDVDRAEALANRIVREARPVVCRSVPRSEAAALGIEAPGSGDSVRLVEAEGFDLQACSGTHPARTSEVGPILVLRHERHRGGSRVSFACGERALAVVRRQRDVLHDLGSRLSAPPEAITGALDAIEARLAATQARLDAQLGRLVEFQARELRSRARGQPPVVAAVLEEWSADDLRRLALAVATEGPVVVLLGSRDGARGHLVFARSEGLDHDVVGALRRVLPLVGGRGGGRGALAQGGGDAPAALEAALEAAEAFVRARA